jgi:RIO-like serine/threonine protein kinase
MPYIINLQLTEFQIKFLEWVGADCPTHLKDEIYKNRSLVLSVRKLVQNGLVTVDLEKDKAYSLTMKGRKVVALSYCYERERNVNLRQPAQTR